MPKTPLIKIANFYLKREDENITGSAKDRATSVQTKSLLAQNITQAVISSTGNAAISAAHFCRQSNINLTIFVSPKINSSKLKILAGSNLVFSNNPIKDAFLFSKQNHAFFLRQSTDPQALIGYQNIATEIVEQLPQVSSIFTAVGSGATLLGISQKIPDSVKLYAVQPAAHCPIASYFDHEYTHETENTTDALSVKYLPLKSKLISVLSYAYVVENSQIVQAKLLLNSQGIFTSNEGALALAGLLKARRLNHPVGEFPVIILTGAVR